MEFLLDIYVDAGPFVNPRGFTLESSGLIITPTLSLCLQGKRLSTNAR